MNGKLIASHDNEHTVPKNIKQQLQTEAIQHFRRDKLRTTELKGC